MVESPSSFYIAELIGYIRVSTQGQRDGLSLPEQARLIQEYCDRNGYNLLAIFCDSESGESIQGREGFLAAVKLILKDGADGMVVLNFDRYSRSTGDSELILRAFRKKDKLLLSVQQGFDLADKYGRFGFRVNQAAAELVREEIVERLYRLRMAKVAGGGWVGHRAPYGWRCQGKELVPDKDEQMVVRLIRRLRKWVKSRRPPGGRGRPNVWMSQYEIRDYLNKRAETDERFAVKSAKPLQKPRSRPYKREKSYLWTQAMVCRILGEMAPSARQARERWDKDSRSRSTRVS